MTRLRIERRGVVGRVALARPEKQNALAYDRGEWDFDEARLQARQALERYRETHRMAY